MPTTQTTLFPPPVRDSTLSESERKYLFSLQNLFPLRLADTSSGSYSEALPNAGLDNSQTGQSNQNQEITYVKSSADSNTFTITGAKGGPYTLTKQNQSLKFKSDGASWWKSGCCAGSAPAS